MSFLRIVLGALSLAFVMMTPGLGATSASVPEAKVNLRDGGVLEGATRLAGLEISLSGKAKTYWRMPGDSGLPPLFDWSGSENVKSVAVEWPRPERMPDAAGTILGYRGQVIFPLLVQAIDPAKPITLKVKLDFGICEEICVPLSADAARLLNDGSDKAAIDAFRALVPKKGALGAAPDPPLLSITRAPDVEDALLVATGAPIADLVLEGPKGWYFGDAAREGGSEAAPVYRVRILEKPRDAALGGLKLIVTLLGDQAATETEVTLDPNGAIR